MQIAKRWRLEYGVLIGRRIAMLAVAVMLSTGASHAAITVFTGSLSGGAESPANASPGTGSTIVTLDPTAQTLRVQVTFSGLTAATTASHIHCCTASPFGGTAGVATTVPTFAGFPLGVTSGTYDATLDLTQASSYNPAFITANGGTVASAEAALIAGMLAGRSYLNIHTTAFPGGEIRAFLTPLAPSIPALDPWMIAALAVVLLAVAFAYVRRKRS